MIGKTNFSNKIDTPATLFRLLNSQQNSPLPGRDGFAAVAGVRCKP